MNRFEISLKEELDKIEGFCYEKINLIDSLPYSVAEKALGTLLFYGTAQNYPMIVLVQEKVKEIDHDWLKLHIIDIAKKYLDFDDYWDFRRFVELIMLVIPELKNEAIKIVENSKDPDVLEAVQDFQEIDRL